LYLFHSILLEDLRPIKSIHVREALGIFDIVKAEYGWSRRIKSYRPVKKNDMKDFKEIACKRLALGSLPCHQSAVSSQRRLLMEVVTLT
jgi:hypothetical protein